MILFICFVIVIAALSIYYFIEVEKINKITQQTCVASIKYLKKVLSKASAYRNEDENNEEYLSYILNEVGMKINELRGSNVISRALILSGDIPFKKRKMLSRDRIKDVTLALACNVFLEKLLLGEQEDVIFTEIENIIPKDVFVFDMEEYSYQINECYELIKKSKLHPEDITDLENNTLDNIIQEKNFILNKY